MAHAMMQGAFLPGNFGCELRTIPVPTPGYGQVLLRVKASSICGSDIRVIYGQRDPAQCEQPSDVICGHEPAGQVVAVGPDCRTIKEGDRVALYHIVGCNRCAACRQGYMLMCEEADMPTDHTVHFKAYGWQRDGGHAEYLLAEERSCVILPEFLSYDDGALIACGFGTAWEALQRVKPSGQDTMLITGMGPVGMAVGLLAKAMGVQRIFGTDASAERLKIAQDKGCIDVAYNVLEMSEDDIRNAIAQDQGQANGLQDLKGVSLAVDCSGVAAARHTAIYCTKRWGQIVFVGEGGTVEFAVSPLLIHKQLTLHGSWVTSLPHMHDLVDFCVRHQLHPDVIVTDRFSLAETHDAYKLAVEGKCGKVVINPS